MEVFAPPDLDTDRFGTFCGETERSTSPVDTAKAKAELAMHATGAEYGLASEASYELLLGLTPQHEEILVFLDRTREICVAEGHRTLGTPGTPTDVTDPETAVYAAREFGFPQQGAIVTAKVGGKPRAFRKGIADADTLRRAIHIAIGASDGGFATVQPDLRAHHNPSRRVVLMDLARRLAARLATPCPACGCPGYGRTSSQPGTPCRDCGRATQITAADIHSCPACPHNHAVARPPSQADPRWCERCNP